MLTLPLLALLSIAGVFAGDADALRGPRKPVGETGCSLVRGWQGEQVSG